MIQSHIDSIKFFGAVLKLKRLSHLSCRSFELSFLIEFGNLSLVFSLKVVVGKGYLVSKRGFEMKAI